MFFARIRCCDPGTFPRPPKAVALPRALHRQTGKVRIVIIGQLVLPGASEYERKSQRIDFASLSTEHDVRVGEIGDADLIHIYASRDFEMTLDRPYISNARPKRRRFRR